MSASADKSDNVKVAVRVRPFNDRERQRKSTLIIDMQGQATTIRNPDKSAAAGESAPKQFSFDHSYWSHDSYREREDGYLEPTSSNYADQKRVFDDLGRGVLDNAWKGYNCSLFAYGQTGSGKSYSIIGYEQNKGIVPMACEELFASIDKKKNSGPAGAEYQVTFSMLEIYNEQVRDLLQTGSAKAVKGGLKIRQHTKKGFYVENLKVVPVSSYQDIDNKMNEGIRNRTLAATNMNATSSRAHTIVAINFTQKVEEKGTNMTKTSTINLVDLAGSERADSTGATGDRLKEGSMINQSLSTLGNCIKALADSAKGNKKVQVPYRDSVLTKLLKNALGGNSKTVMIAALSPADINYEETLSTLRFADRAKAIKTKAVVNESPTEKLIRELKEENAKLLEQLKGHKGGKAGANGVVIGGTGGYTDEEVAEMKRNLEEQLKKNDEEMETMKKSWAQKLQEAAKESAVTDAEEKKKQEELKKFPHLWNLNEDPALTGMITHFTKSGVIRVGKNKASGKGKSSSGEMRLSGLSIQEEHAVINNKDGQVTIKPVGSARVLLNGEEIKDEKLLHHYDRVLFGSNNLYVFQHPQQMKQQKKTKKPTYEDAQAEIAKHSGMLNNVSGKSKEDMLLEEDLIQMLQMTNEANAMSEELDKRVKFDVALISPQARGLKEGRTEVQVKMVNLENGNEWMWDRQKFMNRKFIMQEMYQNFCEGNDISTDKLADPFWEASDSEVLVGYVHVYLQSLGYLIELEENLAITDFKGGEQGYLMVSVNPCKKDGKEITDEFVENPKELVGKPLYFKVKIPHARGLPSKYCKTFVKYKMYLDKEAVKSKEIEKTVNPDYNHEKLFKFNPCTKQFLTYIEESPLVIEVWGRQQEGSHKAGNIHTRDLMGRKRSASARNNRRNSLNDDERQKLVVELHTQRKRAERVEAKLNKIQTLVNEAMKKGQKDISIDVLLNDVILYVEEDDHVMSPAAQSQSSTHLTHPTSPSLSDVNTDTKSLPAAATTTTSLICILT